MYWSVQYYGLDKKKCLLHLILTKQTCDGRTGPVRREAHWATWRRRYNTWPRRWRRRVNSSAGSVLWVEGTETLDAFANHRPVMASHSVQAPIQNTDTSTRPVKVNQAKRFFRQVNAQCNNLRFFQQTQSFSSFSNYAMPSQGALWYIPRLWISLLNVRINSILDPQYTVRYTMSAQNVYPCHYEELSSATCYHFIQQSHYT